MEQSPFVACLRHVRTSCHSLEHILQFASESTEEGKALVRYLETAAPDVTTVQFSPQLQRLILWATEAEVCHFLEH